MFKSQLFLCVDRDRAWTDQPGVCRVYIAEKLLSYHSLSRIKICHDIEQRNAFVLLHQTLNLLHSIINVLMAGAVCWHTNTSNTCVMPYR